MFETGHSCLPNLLFHTFQNENTLISCRHGVENEGTIPQSDAQCSQTRQPAPAGVSDQLWLDPISFNLPVSQISHPNNQFGYQDTDFVVPPENHQGILMICTQQGCGGQCGHTPSCVTGFHFPIFTGNLKAVLADQSLVGTSCAPQNYQQYNDSFVQANFRVGQASAEQASGQQPSEPSVESKTSDSHKVEFSTFPISTSFIGNQNKPQHNDPSVQSDFHSPKITLGNRLANIVVKQLKAVAT